MVTKTKTIKRYANRKLYDTERSCYVTLEDIFFMVKAGEEIRVIDNKSGDDLTSVTLAQIIFETEKKSNFMPLAVLRQWIQSSGDAFDILESKAREVKQVAQKICTEIENKIDNVIIGRKNNDVLEHDNSDSSV